MGPVKIDFSKISGTSLHTKPKLPLKKDFGVMFYERDTRDMYVYDEFEWTLWSRAVENQVQNWVDLGDTPSIIEPGKIPLGNTEGDAIVWADYPNWVDLGDTPSTILPGYIPAGNQAGDAIEWIENITPTGLEAIDEGNGIGWRLIGRDATYYGNVGLNAIDFGFSSLVGEFGAVGDYSLNSSLDGSSPSFGETTSGVYPTNYIPTSASTFALTDRLYNIGNGTSTGSRSDAFTILKNGLITAPSTTSALILAEATGKALLTKEVGISNETDSYVSNAKATNIITLTQAEFDAIIAPSPGTWYAIIG